MSLLILFFYINFVSIFGVTSVIKLISPVDLMILIVFFPHAADVADYIWLCLVLRDLKYHVLLIGDERAGQLVLRP